MVRAYTILFIQGGSEDTSYRDSVYELKIIKWVLKKRDIDILTGFIRFRRE